MARFRRIRAILSAGTLAALTMLATVASVAANGGGGPFPR